MYFGSSCSLPPAWPCTLRHLFGPFPDLLGGKGHSVFLNVNQLPRTAAIFVNVCVKLQLCLTVKPKNVIKSVTVHTYLWTHTCSRGWKTMIVATLKLLWPFSSLSSWLTDAARTTVLFRLLCWEVVTLNDFCTDSTDVNTQHTLSQCGPLDTESLWHFSSISAIQSAKHPTSLNSCLCLYFIHTVGCFPSRCGWLSTSSTPPPSPTALPFNQSGRTCHLTAASDLVRSRWSTVVCTARPPRLHLHYTAVALDLAAVRASETKRCILVYLYFLSLLVSYCNYWTTE